MEQLSTGKRRIRGSRTVGVALAQVMTYWSVPGTGAAAG